MASEAATLADRMIWQRARLATLLALVFLAAQVGSFYDDVTLDAPRLLGLIAWAVWAGALLIFLMLGGGLLRGPRMRMLLNDETTRDHRMRALAAGFWAAITACFVIYVATFYELLGARQGVRLVLTLAIASALLRFGSLERRALRPEAT